MFLNGEKLICISDCKITDPSGNVLKIIKKGECLTIKEVGHNNGEVLYTFLEINSELGSMEYDHNALGNFAPYDTNIASY